MDIKRPTVFVSYSWDNLDHQRWVMNLTNKLRKNGIDATMDIFETQLKTVNLSEMMVSRIRESDYIVIILTENYADKADDLKGGVGFETLLTLPFLRYNMQRIILLMRHNGDYTKVFPFHLKDVFAIDFSNDILFDDKLEELIYKLYNVPMYEKAELGPIPILKPKNTMHSDIVVVKDTPLVLWKVFVGKQKWKNTPILHDGYIYVGSAGLEWNEGDERDGIYCIDSETGIIRWKYNTNSDVNELTINSDKLITGCDDGKAWCLSPYNGELFWELQFNGAVTSRINTLNNKLGSFFFIITCKGEINIVSTSGDIIDSFQIGEVVMANSIIVNECLYVPTINGKIFKLHYDFEYSQFCIDFIYIVTYLNTDNTMSKAQLYSSPIVVENQLYIAYARDTNYSCPPVVCLSEDSGYIQWYGDDSNNLTSGSGNIRSDILLDNDILVFTQSYSNELVGMSKITGEVLWVTKLGREMFQQWASPIMNNKYYILPRHDGYLYFVDKETKQRILSIDLSNHNHIENFYFADQVQPNNDLPNDWELQKGYSLLSKPLIITDTNIICGSDEGFIYSISI